MGKLILEPIQTDLTRGTASPRAFRWRGRRYRITQLGGQWTERGRWWEGRGERCFVRALTDRNTVVDLCFEPHRGRWLLHSLHD